MKTYLFLRFKVKDYSNWRSEFDATQTWRHLQGEKNSHIFKDEDDPNIVTLLCEWDKIDNARKFIGDPQLSEKMQLSGVIEQPIIHFLKKD